MTRKARLLLLTGILVVAVGAAVGVSLRTLYRSIERLEADHRVRLAYRGLMVPEAEMKRIVAHFSSNGVPGSLEK